MSPLPRWSLGLFALAVLFFASLKAETLSYAQTADRDAGLQHAIRLQDVKRWLLLLNNPLENEVIARIAASRHDMVVIDFLSSIKGREALNMHETVARLRARNADAPRLVIAYLNIGQAEDYRTYWRTNWRPGNPGFIISDDPDGWAGNFPVAYWDPRWQQILTGEGGLIDQIAAAGFDGLYLDWVGGFEFEPVVARARAAGIDPADAMTALVAKVSARMKALRPGAIIIPQNAPLLWQRDDFLAAIDAVVQEHTWFSGTDDNAMLGDCPLPRNEEEAAGSPAYLASLPPLCLKDWRENPGSSLRYESEAYLLPLFARARAAGKIVFTVDYALKPENIARVTRQSRGHGFVPFVGARPLTDYVEPLP
ncbi:MAG TPA: endo alpha-1,4 polygalactosaminidase [Micropepsaceae bacterium]|nr:endo alpha-1,4 polygalactosaminidase [Micropepsaceae bacterium]